MLRPYLCNGLSISVNRAPHLLTRKAYGYIPALGLIGTVAVNIVKGAFLTGGYGEWLDITDATKAAKGSTRILVDNKILSGSITYVVRGL